MSNNRIQSPSSPSSSFEPVPAGAAGIGSGVLGLGVDVGVLESPIAQPTLAPVPEPAPDAQGDRFDHDAPVSRREPREFDTQAPDAKNPFDEVKHDVDSATERKLTDAKTGMDTDVDVTAATLAKLAALEQKLGPDHAELCAKLRLGATLLLADMQSAAEKRSAVPQKVIESAARQILERGQHWGGEDHKAFLKLQTQFHAAIGQNIQAYVQRVLRECYLLQNQLLMDYAAKVQHYNDLKKKTRDILEKARSVKTTWAAESKGADGFLADPPFNWLEVGDDGVVYTPKMTADDVAQYKADIAAAASSASKASEASNTGFEVTYGESQLTADDRDVLDELKKKDRGTWGWSDVFGGDSDNYIKDRMDELLPLIPKMNKDDLKTYLLPIIKILTDGNPDGDQLVDIFKALTPTQFLYFQCGVEDFTNKQQGFSASDAKASAEVAAAAGLGFASAGFAAAGSIIGGYWDRLMSGEVFDDSQQSDFELKAKSDARAVAEAAGVEFTGDLTPEKAGELLVALNAKENPTTAPVGDSANPGGTDPTVGSPKQIRTVQGMDDYIKAEEEKLNTIGDDAQLANVDLQNALQAQQQTLQMLSNISKVLHDTALAILRKIGT